MIRVYIRLSKAVIFLIMILLHGTAIASLADRMSLLQEKINNSEKEKSTLQTKLNDANNQVRILKDQIRELPTVKDTNEKLSKKILN
jgi:peptidoglycan hydrolase CwlO-like protein